jgi:adenine deaminase
MPTTLAAIVLVASSLEPAQNPARETATIVHVTVVDVATGKELPDPTVVLRSDHIVSVAAFDPAAAPQGRIVDAHGAFLTPGLWDMHVHIQDLEDLPASRPKQGAAIIVPATAACKGKLKCFRPPSAVPHWASHYGHRPQSTWCLLFCS